MWSRISSPPHATRGPTRCNLRVHVPGVAPDVAREQIRVSDPRSLRPSVTRSGERAQPKGRDDPPHLPLRRHRLARAIRGGRPRRRPQVPRPGRRRGSSRRSCASRPASRRRRTATTTPRCSWCSRASCTFDGQPMSPSRLHRRGGDKPYGFTAGPTACSLLVVRTAGPRSRSRRRSRDRLRPHRPRRHAWSTAPGCRAGASTSACATAGSPRSRTSTTPRRAEEIDADRHDRRARHRRRAHALRPADHVRSVRDDVVLPRRHHRRRRQLRLLGRARASPPTATFLSGIFARVENMDPIALSAITWDEFETFPEFLAQPRGPARRQLRAATSATPTCAAG